MKPENAAFAARIQAAIDDSGLSQAELARRIGKTPQAVSGWIKSGTISKALLPRVAAELGKDLAYFMPEDPLQKPPRLPKRPTGKGHGEGYKELVHAVATSTHNDPEARLLHAFRKMAPEARAALLTMALLLAGCSTTYVRPGATAEDYRTENAQCQVEANKAAAGTGGLVAIATLESTRKACLEGKGWRPAS